MVNLEHLSIHCVLCRSPERSQYLHSLRPRKLRSFSYRCLCGTASHNESGLFLTAPIFDTVETLRWAYGTRNGYLPWWTMESLDKKAILPCVTRLMHHGKPVEGEILSMRPIQRICITSQRLDASFLWAIYTFPGSLTHITMEELSKLDFIISKDAACFVNVRYIGTVPAIPYGDKVRRPVVLIPRLIQFCVLRSSHTWPPSRCYQTSPPLTPWRSMAETHETLICL